MLNQQQEQTIQKFLSVLDKVSHPPGETYDLGLIISDSLTVSQLKGLSPQGKKLASFELDQKISNNDFFNTLAKTFKQKNWLIVKLKDGYLPGQIYSQLRLLSTNNYLQFPDSQDNDKPIDIKIPQESRIIFLINQKNLVKIDNPNFIKLFGPIIKI